MRVTTADEEMSEDADFLRHELESEMGSQCKDADDSESATGVAGAPIRDG